MAKGDGTWDKHVGVLYDLGHQLNSETEKAAIHRDHYSYTLDRIEKLHQVLAPKTIIDLGCGPGILTQHVAMLVGSQARVVGADIREETLRYNRLLRPDIDWILPSDISGRNYAKPWLFLLDGVVNYVSEAQLHELLTLGDGFVFFYSAEDPDGKPANTSIELFALLEKEGYEQRDIELLDNRPDGPLFVVFSALRSGSLADK